MSGNEQNYYSQLHETLRVYQKELWGTPILLFGLEGFIFLKVVNNLQSPVLENLTLLINLFALIMIHIYFEKIRDRNSTLQRKIDEFDSYFMDQNKPSPKRIPLYRGEYNLSSIISSYGLVSATTWFRVATLLFIGSSLYLLTAEFYKWYIQ